jgi:release factor glutamine methyltransferase
MAEHAGPGADAALAALLARRIDGEPLAYVLGTQPFGPGSLRVTPATLIPRPETWQLVEHLVARRPATHGRPLRVLDLGTGCGAIAIALAQAWPDARVTAVDASAAALAVARDNAAAAGVATVRCVAADWYTPLDGDDLGGPFDVIVSNPPYIADGDPHLADLAHEPRMALVAGPDGLAALRVVVAGAVAHLVPGGRLAVEHGHDQRTAVTALFAKAGFEALVVETDAGGIDRIVSGVRAAA